MEKLYCEYPYIKEFTAEIINTIERDSKYYIELDKSYFNPGNEVSPRDYGSINGAPVQSISIEDNVIYHEVAIKPTKIHRVKCIIDFGRRFDYMQQHLGQHLLSNTIQELFNSTTLESKLGANSSFIDVDKFIDFTEINHLEEYTNKIILENIDVETLHPTSSELKKLLNKKVPVKNNEKISLIKIGESQHCICEEIHLKSTIEVQLIKIIRATKIKTGTRFEFICGSRAISDYLLKYEAIDKISKVLSCSNEEMLQKIENLSTELKSANSDRRALGDKVAEFEVQNTLNSCDCINDIRIIKTIYEGVNLKYVNLLGTKLTSFPNVIVLFGIVSLDSTNLLFMKSKDLKLISMNTLLKDAISLIDGKGGGSDYSAQGGGKKNNNLTSCLDYAYNKVKASL